METCKHQWRVEEFKYYIDDNGNIQDVYNERCGICQCLLYGRVKKRKWI